MLTRIAVDGFRSLLDFSLDFYPGLNVLVGPNGSGKSNVIRFLEFISFIHEGRLIESVSKAGGAGEIFYRTPHDQFSKEMSFTIEGETNIDTSDGEELLLKYQYCATIRIAKDFSSIYFPAQKVHLKFYNSSPDINEGDTAVAPPRSSLEVESTLNLSEEVEFRSEKVGNLQKIVDEDFEILLKSEASIWQARETSLVNVMSYSIHALRYVRRDLRIGNVYNINPTIVREPEDIAESPMIKSDGSGLASMLFSLKQNDEPDFFYPYIRPRIISHRTKVLEEIKSYVKLINESILDIDVKYDTFDNKLKVFSTIRSEASPIVIPLALLSDGTVKWLSLVAALLSGSSTFSLEEPENFLHPRMQIELIGIIRSLMHPNGPLKTIIITTHSETVLNSLQPSEVILLQMSLSKTIASRIENQEELNKNIHESGFGLGFYYVTGSM